MIDAIQSSALVARDRLSELLSDLPELSTQLLMGFSGSSPTGSAGWHLLQLLIGVGMAAVGFGARKLVDNWGREQFRYLFNEQPVDRSEKICYLLLRGFMQLFCVAVMFAVAAVLAIVFQQSPAQQADFLLPVTLLSIYQIGSIIFSNILAPDVPSHRLLAFTDVGAQKLSKSLTFAFAIGFGLTQLSGWFTSLGAVQNIETVAKLFASLATVLLLSYTAIRYRDHIALALRGGRETASKSAMFFTRIWHVLAVFYFICAWIISVVRYLLERPNAFGIVASPILALMGAMVVYSMLLVLVDLLAKRHTRSESFANEDEHTVLHQGMVHLGEYAAAVIAWAAAFFYLIWTWGVDLSKDGPILNFVDVMLVLFAGWFTYKAISLLINQKIEDEGGVAAAEPGEEGGSQGGISRIAMLLSLSKKFLLVTVLVIVGMIALSELGIDVAPLFAGAGIVGLAVGFGAQALVRDIFSGAFFLIDDAFRIGEYIDIGSVKGTVEKISIRSMQLRHHMGALHTVPFGEITHLTNFSRDWVMMKLKLRVPYDTDIDRVRKLIKKLGQQLLQHPEVGEKFMQPLKSQGVYSMEDENAIVIRVKFMTKPGDQFQTRKVVYQSIQDLFNREGIRFATQREVVVRVADAANLTDEEKERAGGAAAEIARQASESEKQPPKG